MLRRFLLTKKISYFGLSFLILLAGTFVAVSTASAGPDGKISKRSFHYNNYKYWRAGSVNAPKIGSYGKKKKSTGIDIHSTISSSNISSKIKESGVYSISFKKLKKWGVSIDNLEYADTKASGSVKKARKTNVNLKLLYLTIDNSPLINALNKSKKAKNFMKKSSSRVVSSIWVVVSAKVAETISSAANLSVDYSGSKMKVKASAKTSSRTSTEITIPTGAVFAYMIDKAKWKKKGLKKTSIKALEDDQVGLK